jgi:hypothetical protein
MPRRLYFVGPWVDFACVGGLSIVVFTALRSFFPGRGTHAAAQLSAILLWVVNWPHFSATSYRLYHRRENVMQYPVTATFTPLLVLLGVLASIGYPERVAPFFVKLFLIWSPYHFSGQTVGVTLLYARRAGVPVGPYARRGLALFVFGSFLTQTLRFESGALGSAYFGIPYPALGVPPWAADVALAATWIGGAAFVALTLRASRAAGRILAPIVLVPSVAQFIWFVPGSGEAAFVEFVPAFHSLQYLLIAWGIQLKERLDQGPREPSRRFVGYESARWFALNVAGGALLFWTLPRAFSWAGGIDFLFASGVVLAGVQIHHFFVDGVIWKLRDPSVASPLMVSLDELVAPRAAAAGAA